MNDRDTVLWPYSRRAAVLAVPLILFLLLVAVELMRASMGWPRAENERLVFIGIFFFSVLPLFLILVEILVQHGAVLEFKGLKVNLAQIPPAAPTIEFVATNIGVRTGAVNDSSSAQILDTLRDAMNREVVILDLEDGHAWWETRLLVLMAGAIRLGRPKAVVFLGTIGERQKQFFGWAYSEMIFRCLLRSDERFQRIYFRSQAAARQWRLIEPFPDGQMNPGPPAAIAGPVSLAQNRFFMAFSSGLPNEYAAEQLLASELGEKIENQGPPHSINLNRLQELFLPVLHSQSIDQDASKQDQLRQLTADDSEYIAVTSGRHYVQLVRRLSVLTVLVTNSVSSKA
jgi:hypothetical protein